MLYEVITNDKSVRVELKHFEQLGFEFAAPGDEVWFIQSPSPARGEVNTVVKAKAVNEQFIDLTFANKLPAGLKTGDILV